MRHILLTRVLTISALLTSSPLNAMPVHEWSNRFGGTGLNTAYDVAVDGSGNVVVVGTFAGSMNVGGLTLTSAGSQDIFLAKFDANGVHQWSQRFGGLGADGARAVTVDGAGNITMTGYFRGPVSFGGAPLAGRAALDVFVARFDASGLHQWSQWYGSSNGDEGQDIVADASGNVIVTGHYSGAIDFGGGAVTPGIGSLDVFVLKLDAAGVHQWSKGIGNLNPDIGYGVAVDASNSVLVTGTFNNTVNFGGGPLTSAGLSDVFVVKYDEGGAHQWSTRLGGPTADVGYGIGAGAGGSVVVTGTYNGAFVVNYDTDGAQQWIQSFTSSDMVQSLDLAVSPAGMIAITGNLRGTTDAGGGPLTSAGDDDVFLALCEPTGAHIWSQRFGNSGDDWGHGCAFDPSGNLIATGIFSASVDFGGGPLVSAGLSDVFVVKFGDDVADTTPPLITCPADVQVEQTGPAGTPATHPVIAVFLASVSASDDTDPAPVITHDAPDVFPTGATVVTFHAMDASGNGAECTATVSVLDATPPRITVVLDKNVLWPPNHKFVTVCAEVTVTDDGNTTPEFWLVSITCNEPANGSVNGRASQDIRGAAFGTPDLCFDLRAARAGNGSGRVYQIVYATSDASGNTVYETVQVRVPHDLSDLSEYGASAALTSVHPNPFNPQTTLEYSLAKEMRVSIAIYNARGALVRRLVDQVMPEGGHRVTWNGVGQDGRPVGSGIYFVALAAGSQTETRKIVLLK
ncbi:MAG TPA: HYR domain-containing protein [Candidatus Krumholzibacteria bacterium]|nr:HYR domain-containing protein [Candidatus Krumholzibacteria bacterium]